MTVATETSKYLGTARKISEIWSGLIYNVKDTAYGAKGDGVTDDTAAIQAAINAASIDGGICFVPPGQYVIRGQLNVLRGAKLVGVNKLLTIGEAIAFASQTQKGSVFICKPTNPAIALIIVGADTLIEGIFFNYTEQSFTNSSAVTLYGPTISNRQLAYNKDNPNYLGEANAADSFGCYSVNLRNLAFRGSTSHINFAPANPLQGGLDGAGLVIENVYGYPVGGYFVKLDGFADLHRINNLHSNPGILGGASLADHEYFRDLSYVSDGIILGGCDNFVHSNIFIIGCRRAYTFKNSECIYPFIRSIVTTSYTTDGSTSVWNTGFNYLSSSNIGDIIVIVENNTTSDIGSYAVNSKTILTRGSGYTATSDSTITVSPALPSGLTLKIYRPGNSSGQIENLAIDLCSTAFEVQGVQGSGISISNVSAVPIVDSPSQGTGKALIHVNCGYNEAALQLSNVRSFGPAGNHFASTPSGTSELDYHIKVQSTANYHNISLNNVQIMEYSASDWISNPSARPILIDRSISLNDGQTVYESEISTTFIDTSGNVTNQGDVQIVAGESIVNMAPGSVPSNYQTLEITLPFQTKGILSVFANPVGVGEGNVPFGAGAVINDSNKFTLHAYTTTGVNYSFGKVFRWIAYVRRA